MTELDEIEFILMEYFADTGEYPTKHSVDANTELPSYNTCMRRGLSLEKLNRKLREHNLNPTTCLQCSLHFYDTTGLRKFCSQSCAAVYNNAVRKQLNYSKVKQCPVCYTEVTTSSTYCSIKCYQELQLSEGIKKWVAGDTNFGCKVVKRMVTRVMGYTCNHCGISEHNNKPLTLELDHINGNSEDNSPKNLCLLCPNCHSQTSTYKGKNKGNGRHSRMVRYHEGKSF
jgi:hypothetical protein